VQPSLNAAVGGGNSAVTSLHTFSRVTTARANANVTVPKDALVALPLIHSAATNGLTFGDIAPREKLHGQFSQCIDFLKENFAKLPENVQKHLTGSFKLRFVGGNAIGSFPALSLPERTDADEQQSIADMRQFIGQLGEDLASQNAGHSDVERDLQYMQFICMCADTITEKKFASSFGGFESLGGVRTICQIGWHRCGKTHRRLYPNTEHSPVLRI
jgi:hypothetical protein